MVSFWPTSRPAIRPIRERSIPSRPNMKSLPFTDQGRKAATVRQSRSKLAEALADAPRRDQADHLAGNGDNQEYELGARAGNGRSTKRRRYSGARAK